MFGRATITLGIGPHSSSVSSGYPACSEGGATTSMSMSIVNFFIS